MRLSYGGDRMISHSSSLFRHFTSLLALTSIASAGLPQLNLDDADSIKQVASRVAYDMMTFYTGNHTGDVPGNLPPPYYWWEVGGMFGALINYYYYTGDKTYNDVVTQGMIFQSGPDHDYMTPNQTKTTGNDDQGFWAMAAMAAAEQGFPDPPEGQPGWLALAQATFNTQAYRWDDQFCNGGLRWQVFTFNNGYNYKNTISNGVFFNLAARLAVYTGNDSYAQWAEKVYNWEANSGFMTPQYNFYDGAHTDKNCTDVNKVQWTYNVGVMMLGAANMYNYTNGSSTWGGRVEGMVQGASIFFSPPRTTSSYLSRWMAATTKMAPFTYDTIKPLLRASAQAAVSQCTGGQSGTMCGMIWTNNGVWDGTTGVGQQMSVLETVQTNLIQQAKAPFTNKTGGTSKGNPGGGGQTSADPTQDASPIGTKDRAGAGILTTLVLIWLLGGLWWMVA
ncbi:MAG: hypothetical protein OHK93_000552 [Ramalina farinacea]|uniref:Mannan endo-1,6-alpha-mannosidase n=1 Tax=Ramalina farinacea TaxID=258253 RepID=A0AA43TSP1_9LECA|nr:hypothetical protein [Ramalina farinacea]